ncbi:MAG: hypothetical protein SCALA702_18050 [Melioribacteraceae bacterium]|nr:MAG: hypothetical protein SCALA702_18050 [Melioribacteraceae bacterium]
MIYLILLILLIVIYTIVYAIIALMFASSQQTAKTKLGVVFNHRLEKNGILSDASVLRLEHCAYMYKLDKYENVFCVGGYDPEKFIFSSEINSQFLIESGIEPEDIHEVSYSFNTWSNCTETLDIMREYKYFSATLISSPLHLLRIAATLNRIGFEVQILFSSPDIFSYFSGISFLSIAREVLEESIKIMTLLIPKHLYQKIILGSLQSGKLKRFRRISKF